MSCAARYFVNLPEKLDLEMYYGQSFPLPTILQDELTGDPFDLTGWTALAEIRKQSDGTLVETFTYTSTSPTTGALVLSLTPTQVNNVYAQNPDAMVWDFKLSKGGEVIWIYYGDILAERYNTESNC